MQAIFLLNMFPQTFYFTNPGDATLLSLRILLSGSLSGDPSNSNFHHLLQPEKPMFLGHTMNTLLLFTEMSSKALK